MASDCRGECNVKVSVFSELSFVGLLFIFLGFLVAKTLVSHRVLSFTLSMLLILVTAQVAMIVEITIEYEFLMELIAIDGGR
jgi:hypothetical protein